MKKCKTCNRDFIDQETTSDSCLQCKRTNLLMDKMRSGELTEDEDTELLDILGEG